MIVAIGDNDGKTKIIHYALHRGWETLCLEALLMDKHWASLLKKAVLAVDLQDVLGIPCAKQSLQLVQVVAKEALAAHPEATQHLAHADGQMAHLWIGQHVLIYIDAHTQLTQPAVTLGLLLGAHDHATELLPPYPHIVGPLDLCYLTWGNFGYPREAGNTSVCFNFYFLK